MRDFKDLEVWKKSIDLAERIYIVTKKFPSDEKYGLISQLRRAIISVSSNIAEGCGRRTSKNFVGFLYNAFGSVKEIESQLMISYRLKYIEKNIYDELVNELDSIGKMLRSFIDYVSRRNVK